MYRLHYVIIAAIIFPMITPTPVLQDTEPMTPVEHSEHTFIAMPVSTLPGSPEYRILPSQCHHFPQDLNTRCLEKIIHDTCISHHTPLYMPLLGFRTEYSYLFNTYFYRLDVSNLEDGFMYAIVRKLKSESNWPILREGRSLNEYRFVEFQCERVVPQSVQMKTWYRGAGTVNLFFHVRS